ncbi:GNAT family N-acetyltransferase [Photorhabdus noenieputensis]|uniref:GNAT family N-acetyltransferase n=1 Tax=Photorhabdus noenieputensis TaxID=1208607 RepID=UPI001BD5696C|nr:GNAT family N-acetyltransferase [Photorhabdus noenieputensis]MCK3670741.1 GNAT family N-acetyltransferase [Photorhabdus noenieputensis]
MEKEIFVFREVNVEDANNLIVFFNELDNTSEFMLLEPGERKTSVEEQVDIIKGFGKDRQMLICEDNKNIVGFIVISRGVFNRNRHLGSIALGVKKEYRNKGIARILIDKAQDWSRKNGISRLELTVAIRNTLAIKRYLSSGFIFSGIRTGSLFINGELIDEYYMNKEIMTKEISDEKLM